MYWHGAHEHTRRTVNKIIADRAMDILVVTGIGSSPCPSEDLKPTLDWITLNEMQLGPEEQLFIDAKGIPMPAPGQAWSTKAFLVDGSQCQPTGDEAFIRKVEAVTMRVIFEEKSDPTESVDVLSHSEIDGVVAYVRMGMQDRVAAQKERAQAKSPHWWDDRELMTGKFEKVRGKSYGPLCRPIRWSHRVQTLRHGVFQEKVTNSTNSGRSPEIFQDYRWERPPTSMNRAYRTRRCQTWIHKRHTPP